MSDHRIDHPCSRSSASARGVLFLLLGTLLPALTPHALLAQNVIWSKTFGGALPDGAHDLKITSDGGIILAGFNGSGTNGIDQFYLLKLYGAGDEVWSRTYGELNRDDVAASVLQASDGGFVFAGRGQVSNQTHDAELWRTDALGNVIWQRAFTMGADTRAHSVVQTSDGGFILAGQTHLPNEIFANYDVWIAKTDASGILEWQRSYEARPGDDSGNDIARSIQQTSDGGYIVGGQTMAGWWDAYILRLDPFGDILWERTMFENAYADECHAIRQTADGGFVFTGVTVEPGHSDTNLLLGRLDDVGNTLWTRNFGTHAGSMCEEVGQSIDITGDGGFLIAGQTSAQSAGSWDAWVIRTDANGEEVWTRQYGGVQDDRAFSIGQTVEGDPVLCGWTYSEGAGSGDAWIMKLGDSATTAVPETPSAFLSGDLQAWPNPTTGPTTLFLANETGGLESLLIFDSQGKRIRTLQPSASAHWDGLDDQGAPVAAGTYFAVATTRLARRSTTLTLIR